jgi:hypothetical protein
MNAPTLIGGLCPQVLLQPFCHAAARTQRKVLLNRLRHSFFGELIKAGTEAIANLDLQRLANTLFELGVCTFLLVDTRTIAIQMCSVCHCFLSRYSEANG